MARVARSRHPAGEPDRGAVAPRGHPVDDGPARVAEAEKPRDLVIGLSGGVVDRRPQFGDRLGQGPHVQELRVSAGDQQRHALG